MMDKFIPWLSRFVFLSLIIVFVGFIPEIAGIDPAQAVLRARAGAQQLLTAEALQAVRDDLQISSNAFERVWQWFTQTAQGDLGVSWLTNAPVLPDVVTAAKTSLLLMLSSLGITVLLCLVSVLYNARCWQQNHLKTKHNLLASLLVSLPEYVVALLLILTFSIWLDWLPPYGWQNISNLWLPSIALALPATGLLSRLVNDSLKQVLKEPWVVTWLSANVSVLQILRYALIRALTNLMPQIALVIIGLTGGAVAVEQVFSIPGLGRLLLGAVKAQDLPMLQAGLLLLLLFSMAVSSLAIFIQAKMLGHSVTQGKLITSSSSFRFTQSKAKLVLSFSLFALLFGCAFWALLRDPYSMQFARLAAPSTAIPFGADALGRDLLARIGSGMLMTFKMGAVATLASLVIGLLLGFIARFSQGLIEITKGLPYIVVGLLVAGLTGMSEYSGLLAIILVAWAPLAAHCASLVMEAKAQPYVHLAPIWGTGRWRIWRYYLIPYVFPPLFRHTLLRFPAITLSLTSLSFIGLGAKPPTPEWGLLIAENAVYIERAPQGVLLPILGLAMVTIAINLLFDD